MVEGSTEPPAALTWFPAEKRQSLRLVPESVLGIRLLKRGYMGQYEFGKAFVVSEESPESAAALLQKLRARFGDDDGREDRRGELSGERPLSRTALHVP